MPFHVEVRSPHQHARVFNLDESELARILRPWVADQTFELGEQEWEPRESKLTILEGKALNGPDLAFGQGWSNASRSSEDVTRRLVEAEEGRAPLAQVVAVEGDSVERGAAALASGDTPVALEWSEARTRIDRRDPAVAAVIVVLRPSGPEPSRS
jgi:hypothetical protein